MVDKSAYAIAHREARGRLADQMTGLKELRDRAVTVVSVSTGAITIAVSATAALADDHGAMDGLGILAAVVALEAFVLVVVGVVTVFAPVTGQWAIEPAEIVRWIDPPADPDGPEPFDAGKVDRNMALLLGARANENAERLAFRYAWFTVAVLALAVEVLALAHTVWRYTT